ncbi:MAG: hypothetical protein ACRCTZ_13730 [Sarcina sp.]
MVLTITLNNVNYKRLMKPLFEENSFSSKEYKELIEKDNFTFNAKLFYLDHQKRFMNIKYNSDNDSMFCSEYGFNEMNKVFKNLNDFCKTSIIHFKKDSNRKAFASLIRKAIVYSLIKYMREVCFSASYIGQSKTSLEIFNDKFKHFSWHFMDYFGNVMKGHSFDQLFIMKDKELFEVLGIEKVKYGKS